MVELVYKNRAEHGVQKVSTNRLSHYNAFFSIGAWKLVRHNLLPHGARLRKQSGGKREEASISGFNKIVRFRHCLVEVG